MDRRCSKCTASLRQRYGCVDPIPEHLPPLEFAGEQLRECPLRPFNEDPTVFNELVRVSNWIERGMLREAGTWLDQPAVLTDALEVHAAVLAEVREIEEAKAKRPGKPASR